ncbi:TPM domain-containing protein [Campylobacter sp. RM16192]|uniref:TPM domain-containing protein n=1 Tax=Campylobacter sp. RM16192 TaxID=1660080 RepID=UPI0014518B6E|nr:TPM domain-containing protein [Campylobacter sp. RM16192]QCD52537.1 putative phosphatase (TPM domain) [Campylobacter sp. RM16192]
MRKILFILLAFISLFSAEISLPEFTGRVVDEANILTKSAKDSLIATLEAHEKATTNQIVVVTLKSLQNRSIENYSLALARKWAIGQKDKDNGVLLVVVPSEREVRIEVGYGLEGVLTDAASKSIIEKVMVPKFKSGDFEEGVLEGVARILDFTDEDASNNVVKEQVFVDNVLLVIAFLIASCSVFIFIGRLSGRRVISDIGSSIVGSIIVGGFVGAIISAPIDPIIYKTLAILLSIVVAFPYVLKEIMRTPDEKLIYGWKEGVDSYKYFVESEGGSGSGTRGGGGSFGGGGASGKW